MRELKFRAWNTVRNCWTSRVELDGGWGKPMFMHGEIENDSGYQTDNTIIEQYTGLKDKNGREIYEGDIVKMSLELAIRQVGFVCFVEGRFLVKDYEWEDGTFHIVEFYDYNIPKEDFEVIGNIHENPELLEGE